jgi:very-short-patch-repair endonuclease
MSESIKMPYPSFDEKSGKIFCQICGKPFLVISPKHLVKHGITHSDYTKRYPEAPLSSKEFATKAKYGKIKDLFLPKEIENDQLEEIIVTESVPRIEDNVNIEKILKAKSNPDPIKQIKAQILDILRSYFSNIKSNYLVEEFSPANGNLLCHYITDFADPVLRIVFQFPNTYWHNKDVQIDPLKNENLRLFGWKVLVVKSKLPTREEIQKVINEI